MRKVRILIADDHKMVREGICSMLQLYKNKFHFSIDVTDSGVEAVKMAKTEVYDIVIMDYQMPVMNGVMATKRILKANSKIKVLAISNYDEYANITSMINAGARGFILKNVSSEELIAAITAVLNNKNYYSSDVAVKLVHGSPAIVINPENSKLLNALSKRELEILRLITMEYTNLMIAKELKLSKRTIDKHRQHLLEKLNTRNTAGLIIRAFELNLFK